MNYLICCWKKSNFKNFFVEKQNEITCIKLNSNSYGQRVVLYVSRKISGHKGIKVGRLVTLEPFKWAWATLCRTQWGLSHFEVEFENWRVYSHPSNNRGGWSKRRGGAKVAKSVNVEVGINEEDGIFWNKVVHKCNKREVEDGKNLRNQ